MPIHHELNEFELSLKQQIEIEVAKLEKLRQKMWLEADNFRDQMTKLEQKLERHKLDAFERFQDVKDTNRQYLVEIRELHKKYVFADCDGCDGSGSCDTTVTCDYPSILDPMVPAEETVTIVCEDCNGTGKSWGTA